MGDAHSHDHAGSAETSHPLTLEVIHHEPQGLSGMGRLLHEADVRISQAGCGRIAVRAVTGARAFRHFSVLRNAAPLNVRGQFTGEVVSAKWMAAFRYTIEEGEYGALKSAKYLSYAEQVGAFVGFAADMVEAWPRLRLIVNSRDSHSVKGMQMVAIAGTAAQRTLLGIVPTGVHLIYRSLEGWCQIAGLGSGKLQLGASECFSTLQSADALVQTSFKTITNTGDQSKAFWWLVDAVVSRR